jgi:hypothetical protein
VSPRYFFSYARKDAKGAQPPSLLDVFFGDLLDEVRTNVPGSDAFRDERDLDLGVAYEPELLGQLCTARAMLAIYSPAYFQSEYCGKEWGLFRSRALSAEAASLIPVLWVPAELPKCVGAYQHSNSDFPPMYAQQGLRYLVQRRLSDPYRLAYLDSVHALGHALSKALMRSDLLASRTQVPSIDELPNVFSVPSLLVPRPSLAPSAADANAPNTAAPATKPHGEPDRPVATKPPDSAAQAHLTVDPAVVDASSGPVVAVISGIPAGTSWWFADPPAGFDVQRVAVSNQHPRGGLRVTRADQGAGATGALRVWTKAEAVKIPLVAEPNKYLADTPGPPLPTFEGSWAGASGTLLIRTDAEGVYRLIEVSPFGVPVLEGVGHPMGAMLTVTAQHAFQGRVVVVLQLVGDTLFGPGGASWQR